MQVSPTLPDFLEFARLGNVVPVWVELTADGVSPVAAYVACKGQSVGPSFLLESVAGGEHLGRYSFLGVRPREVITAKGDTVTLRERDGSVTTLSGQGDPLRVVEARMARAKAVPVPGLPPFSGGAVGFVGYEYVHCVEPTVPQPVEDPMGVPTVFFAIMDQVVAFDHARQTLRVLCNAHLDEFPDAEAAYRAAVATLAEMVETLRRAPSLAPAVLPAKVPTAALPSGNFTQERFEGMVNEVKGYIAQGDVIQVVGSQRFEVAAPCRPLALYRALRVVNPSPYMFLYETPDFSIVGASPEVHVRSTAGRVEIRPIAGTRPRSEVPEEDAALEADLLADPKERAEHLMLVDLARNDIGRVCQPGTVTVEEYATVERYSHVMHIVSQVEGRLRPAATVYDLLRATFPAGTLSGAPKVRAMQIISALEGQQRGIYGGALGYFDYHGNLDSCITIRTALLKDGQIYLQSGAGLVADSQPAAEYQETINKARGLLRAITLAALLEGE